MGSRRIFAALSGAVVLGGLGFVVSGCGGSSSAATPPAATTVSASASTSTPTSTTPSGRPRTGAFAADFQKFQSCLKSHGITIPSFQRRANGPPTFTTTGTTSTTPRRFGGGGFFGGLRNLSATQQKAMQACQKLLP